jgi:hypothetical protein
MGAPGGYSLDRAGAGAYGPVTEGMVTEGMVLRATPPGTTPRLGSPWSGSLRLMLRHRGTDDPAYTDDWETDNDLYTYLRLKYRDEGLPGLSASFHGRLTGDLDDFGNVRGFYPFDNITDTYADAVNARIYHAYLSYRLCNSPVAQVRLGRQWLDVGEYITFDGLYAESARTACGCFGIAAFAGIPTYLFEPEIEGDFTGGLQLFAKPWKGGELELDWTHVQDRNVYGDMENDLFNLVWNQRIGTASTARVQYQHLDDEPRLFRGSIDAVWLEADAVVRGYFHTLLNAQAERAYDFDYYFWAALDLEPYWQGHVAASKAIGTCLDAEVGFTMRRLFDSADEGVYNREWEQYFAAVSSYDWLLEGLSLTLTGEYWNSTEDFWTAVFDIEYRPSRCWRFVLGTDYSAYQYDIFLDDELENVYSVYARVGWRPSQRWNFDVRVRVEDTDYGTYTTLDAMAQFNF